MNKSWRTLVRAERYDDNNLYVILPGWDVHQDVRISRKLIPEYVWIVIEREIEKNGVYRFHIQCNIDANDLSELRIEHPWELDNMS